MVWADTFWLMSDDLEIPRIVMNELLLQIPNPWHSVPYPPSTLSI